MKTEYHIPQENARAIALGLYRDIGKWIADAKRDNAQNYREFAEAYLARQAETAPQIKHRRSRKVSQIDKN